MTFEKFLIESEPAAVKALLLRIKDDNPEATDDELMELLETEVATYSPTAVKLAELYIRGLEGFFASDTFEVLKNNLALHYLITSGDPTGVLENPANYLASKYNITSTSSYGLASSASNSKSSASFTYPKKVLDNSNLDLLDFQRTPYGRQAYIYLSNLSGIAII